MLRTRFVNCWLFLLLFLLGSLFVAAPCVSFAEDDPGANGEPTDPEGAFRLLESVKVEDYGIQTVAPEGEKEWLDWFQSLINLLYQLGIIGGDGSTS